MTFSFPSITTLINADTNGLVTFMLTSKFANPTNNYTFASKENGDYAIPTLTLVTTVPEPSSLALFGLGMLGFAGFSRLRKK